MPATASSARSERPEAAPKKGGIRRAKEAQILRAAERVFARTGFAGARMADIAAAARLPKPNLHYYFRSKRALYRAVLANILELWLAETDIIAADADPAAALGHYVRAKMRFSRFYPDASRVFANEIIHGAPEIGGFLRQELKALVERKSAAISAWVAERRMAPLDPRHLFFAIWAMTQTYADFATQIEAVLGVPALGEDEFAAATEEVVRLVLRGCGLDGAPKSRVSAARPSRRRPPVGSSG
ncbi:MAG TPA: TetR family transcriptional regulator C-terminal domain-containing protein [Stellaceae bacterium]|nr:TetR family transcriptional regulator C-terminal domain-containing protein [Stellaceae bacterium]